MAFLGVILFFIGHTGYKIDNFMITSKMQTCLSDIMLQRKFRIKKLENWIAKFLP
jgi:hypothetical protein